MNYDEAIKRIEEIVHELEQSEALSMDMYQARAKEAKELLTYCHNYYGRGASLAPNYRSVA